MLLSVLIIAICMALFCVKVIFKKNGKFSSQHVHDNPGLRKRAFIVWWIRTARQGKPTRLIRK